MGRAALLAAGLLSLTLTAACSQDVQQRSTAAPANVDLPSAAAPLSAPPVRAQVSPAPSPPGPAPLTAVTAAAAPARTAAPRAAAPAPAPTRTATTRSSPAAPRRTAAPAPAPSPSRAPAPSSQHALTIRDFAFSPRLLTIPAGSTVTATNEDEATHDWTSESGVWRSGDLPQGASYSFTFPTAGSYDYLCERHPQMTGTVTVTPR